MNRSVLISIFIAVIFSLQSCATKEPSYVASNFDRNMESLVYLRTSLSALKDGIERDIAKNSPKGLRAVDAGYAIPDFSQKKSPEFYIKLYEVSGPIDKVAADIIKKANLSLFDILNNTCSLEAQQRRRGALTFTNYFFSASETLDQAFNLNTVCAVHPSSYPRIRPKPDATSSTGAPSNIFFELLASDNLSFSGEKPSAANANGQYGIGLPTLMNGTFKFITNQDSMNYQAIEQRDLKAFLSYVNSCQNKYSPLAKICEDNYNNAEKEELRWKANTQNLIKANKFPIDSNCGSIVSKNGALLVLRYRGTNGSGTTTAILDELYKPGGSCLLEGDRIVSSLPYHKSNRGFNEECKTKWQNAMQSYGLTVGDACANKYRDLLRAK